MQRVTDPTTVTTLPAATSTGSPGFFTDGNPSESLAATIVTDDWLNGVQEEIIGVIEAAGLTPSIANNAQLLAAIQVLPPGRLLNIQIFTASGTYTPTPGTNAIDVEVQGAGGAAGGSPATASGQSSAGGGGGSGAWAWGRFLSGFSGAAVTVGIGGAGVSGSSGGNGTASSFGALCAANGGFGGSVAGPVSSTTTFVATGGTGGAAGTSGAINVAGNAGAPSLVLASQGIPQSVAPGRYLAGYGAGGNLNSISPSTSAVTGASGKGGVVIVREYS